VRVFEKQSDESWGLVATADHAHEQDVNCVAWYPNDARILASCSDDGTINIWRYETAAPALPIAAAATSAQGIDSTADADMSS
jgi:WD40 repeat protein